MGSVKRVSFQKLVVIGCCFLGTNAIAEQQYASKERSTIARAHVSRARALMVEALAEFEEAKKYARPDMLIDSEDWRLRVISLTEQLNRVVDPKPRVTREGAVFRTPPRFVKRHKDELADVADGAHARSDAGERERMKQKQQERARLFSDKQKAQANNKANLPEELALPDEPILENLQPGKEKAETKNTQESKNLFSNDLMPQLPEKEGQADKGVVGKKVEENTVTKKQEIIIEDKIVEPLPTETKKIIVEEKKENSILGEKENTKSLVVEEDQELDLSNNQLVPPQERTKKVTSIITSESVPTVADDEAELSDEQAAKQITEDDELAKKLEDSISKKLSQRDSERN